MVDYSRGEQDDKKPKAKLKARLKDRGTSAKVSLSVRRS